MTSTPETIRVRWSGGVHRATVLRRYKNRKVRVEIHGSARWAGGRPGSSTDSVRVTVDPWQVVDVPLTDVVPVTPVPTAALNSMRDAPPTSPTGVSPAMAARDLLAAVDALNEGDPS